MKSNRKKELFELFKSYQAEAITANQYDLEDLSEGIVPASEWSEFLREPDVKSYIKKEMEVITTSEIHKMVKDSADSRSVGQSQLINALSKLEDSSDENLGPAFIYCYIPLTEEQQHATNVKPFNITNDLKENDITQDFFEWHNDEIEELAEDNEE